MRQFSSTNRGRPIANSIQRESVGFAFIKGGYEDIAAALQSDFEVYGVETLHSRAIVLDPKAIDYFYRDSQEQHFYPDMRHYLATSAVRVLTLFHASKNAQDIIHKLKTGSDGFENLRDKYRHPRAWIEPAEVALWEEGMHPAQYATTVALTQHNVFHAADSTEEALRSLWWINRTTPGLYTMSDMRDARVGDVARLLTVLTE